MRKALSLTAKHKLRLAQEYLCAECQCDLDGVRVEYDHILPLALGGTNEIENFQALCAPCHREKTNGDVSRISKADRQALRTGQQKLRALRAANGLPPLIPSPANAWRGQRGFPKNFRRRMNGKVEKING